MPSDRRIAVIGLGYVGLPVAVGVRALGRSGHRFRHRRDARRGAARRPATARARSSRAISRHPTLTLTTRSGGARARRISSSSRCRRRSTTRAGPISTALLRPRETVGGRSSAATSSSTSRRSIPAPSKRTACRCWSSISGLTGRPGFHGRLFAGAHQSGRQGASVRDHRQGGRRAGRAHARYRRRGLRLGGHGRHPPGAVDQGGGSRQGDREHPARPQHRVHERAVGDLPLLGIDTGDVLAAAAHQVEFPDLHVRAWSAATASASIPII